MKEIMDFSQDTWIFPPSDSGLICKIQMFGHLSLAIKQPVEHNLEQRRSNNCTNNDDYPSSNAHNLTSFPSILFVFCPWKENVSTPESPTMIPIIANVLIMFFNFFCLTAQRYELFLTHLNSGNPCWKFSVSELGLMYLFWLRMVVHHRRQSECLHRCLVECSRGHSPLPRWRSPTHRKGLASL